MSADSFRADAADAPLSIATYDGGNELIHPSVVDMGAGGWNGKRYWMAGTPYAGSVVSIENPSIYCSDSLDGPWLPPAGLTNPIDPFPGGTAYNSDPHLVDGRDGFLYCFYREFNPGSVGSEERILYRRSSDGIAWGAETPSLLNNSTVRRIVSPAVEWDGAQWVMYGVDIVPASYAVVRLTSPSLSGPWSAPVVVPFSLPSGRVPWHMDAKYVSGYWWLLIQDTVTGGSTGGTVYLCRSADGLTAERPALSALSPTGAWHSILYRSCLIPAVSAGQRVFDVLYTGIKSGVYGIGRTRLDTFDLAAYNAEPAAAIAGAVAGTAPFLIGDDFNRADGAIGTASSGEVWTVSAGVPSVIGNEAGAASATNTRGFIEAASADGYFEITLAKHVAPNQSYLVFRFSDASNYWRVGFSGDQFIFQKIAAGAATSLNIGSSLAILGDGTVRVGVLCSGSNLTLSLDGKTAYTYTDSFNSTATRAGFQTNNTVSRVDNLFAKTI